MNREIKFRAWDKIANMWLDITCFESFDGVVVGIFHDGDYVGLKDIELMQYTGLKDKNGKEIYEGDIIEKTYYSYHQPECSELFEIKYEGLGFHFEHIKGNTFYLPFTEDIEIVGNIYENPELLEVENE